MARVLEHQVGAHQATRGILSLGFDIAVMGSEGAAHLGQAGDMDVDRPATEIIAPRQRDACTPTARQQRAEDDDRRPDLLDQLVGSLRDEVLVGGDIDREALPIEALDSAPERLEHLGHRVDIGDVGDVLEDVGTLSEQCRCHELEDGVLRSPGGHLAVERRSGPDEDALHDTDYYRSRVLARTVRHPRPQPARQMPALSRLV